VKWEHAATRKKDAVSWLRRNVLRILLLVIVLTVAVVIFRACRSTQETEQVQALVLFREQPSEEIPELEEKKVAVDEIVQQPLTKAETLIEVPYINQQDYFPTGCEVVSGTMLLNFFGYDDTADDMVDNYLVMADLEIGDNGEIQCVTPYDAFIGNPRNPESYGCFAPVIVDMLNQAVDDKVHAAYDLTGVSLDVLESNFLQNDIPVAVWVTINMLEPYPSTSWQVVGTDEVFTWPAQEHCMVLVGYDEAYYYFNDPYGGNGTVAYGRELTQARYEALGQQAVVLLPKDRQESLLYGDAVSE
jgi:uncharacterized protein YvpB